MSNLTNHIPSYMPTWRLYKDRLATLTISAGGASVLMAILLIFFYLLYEVMPLFSSATIEKSREFQLPTNTGTPVYSAVEEQGEVALIVDGKWQARFFNIASSDLLEAVDLTAGSGPIVSFASEGGDSRVLGMSHADGQVSLYQHEYALSYPDGERLITPRLELLYADDELGFHGQAVTFLAIRDGEEQLTIAGILPNSDILVKTYAKEVDFLSGEENLKAKLLLLPVVEGKPVAIHIDVDQRWLFILSEEGHYGVVDLANPDKNGVQTLADSGMLFRDGGSITSSSMLLGGISLLAASNTGELAQYFMVRKGQNNKLETIRHFDTQGAVIKSLIPEHRRKGFLVLDEYGLVQIFHSTAHRMVLREKLPMVGSLSTAAISPRGNSMLLVDDTSTIHQWKIHNEHPDVSWTALWDKIWYESYDQPEYIWQSSAANNDFEPKISFTPLAFGTLKAAFYAMLIATPLAICGAIYTAYFMAPALRRKVKPLIELMEALPTVILGFLAGLWLAPFIEDKLTGVFTVMLILPVGILLFAFMWSRLPMSIRTAVPEGWHPALLLPVICLLGYLCFALNDSMEILFFGGDMRKWITNEMGISFDQRNAMVVGIAMGMAVIPTIFSIAEDAIFSVPKHLSYGSLALGATPWQTLLGVVLPTASPGIFSGLMIGMGRAVGETMIVLMATGNTPIMDANIFEGMRTMAANIAVEVPEAEVNSSHFRVLFLAAFVLFMFTFIINTVAELIRQRLRIRYGSL